MTVFAQVVADYVDHGRTKNDILAHVRRCRVRVPMIREAREMIVERGWKEAVNGD
jgi:hypothetical protein